MAKRDGSLATLKALMLIDMIGDRDLDIRRDTNSTPWLTNVIWETARRQNLDDYFIPDSTRIEDDHLPFLAAGIPSVDIIDLDYEAWHTAKDTLDAVSARSLQVVGDVVLGALPHIEAHLSKTLVLTGRRVVSAPAVQGAEGQRDDAAAAQATGPAADAVPQLTGAHQFADER